MHPAPDWQTAAAAAAVLAIVAKLARAVTWDGAVAGLAVGVATALGFGVAGLVVLGTFFVVGSAATKAGYATKAARGAAEATGGARGAARVLGKGGVAAAIALLRAADALPADVATQAFAGAVAAALADTLGTEVGTLALGAPRLVFSGRRVPVGTPGAVSILGTIASGVGAALVAAVALVLGLVDVRIAAVVAAAGFVAPLAESVALGFGLRAPGFVRNLLTTAVGAALATVVRGAR